MERKKKREGGNNILLAVSVLRVLMYVLSWCVVLLWLCDILIWFLSRSRFRLFGGDGDGGSRFSSSYVYKCVQWRSTVCGGCDDVVVGSEYSHMADKK